MFFVVGVSLGRLFEYRVVAVERVTFSRFFLRYRFGGRRVACVGVS